MDLFDLKVGFTCNNNCVHCVVSTKRKTKDLTTEQIKELILNLEKPYTIGFTGGEATLREDFIELLQYAKSLGHQTSLQTNGTKLYDEEYIKQIKPYIDRILIAIHSYDTETHDKIVGSKGMGEKTLKGLENLVKYNISHGTQTVVTKLNLHTLEQTYDYIQKISPKTIMNITYPHQIGNAANKEILVQYIDMAEILYNILNKYASLINIEAIPYCYLYPFIDKLNTNHDDMCTHIAYKRTGIDPSQCNTKFFNEKGITLKYNEMTLLDKVKGPLCKKCSYNSKCVGVWKEYLDTFKNSLDLFPIEIDFKKVGSLLINGSTKCLNTCIFCEGKSKEIEPTEKFNKIMKEAKYFIDNNYEMIDISGGDPGEYERLPEILYFLKQSNTLKKIQLSTHGRTLNDKKLISALINTKISEVRIPLYGSTPELHDKVVGFKGAFLETLCGLQYLSKNYIPIIGYIAINKYNENDIENIIDLYFYFPNIRLSRLMVSLTSLTFPTKEYMKDWYLPIKDMKEVIKRVNRKFYYLSEKHPMTNFFIYDLPYCLIGKNSTYIYNNFQPPDRGINELDVTLKSEIKNVPNYRIKTHFKECDECKLKCRCDGIPKNDFNLFGSEGLEAIK